jgi:acetolactate synthase-1/2/3 large subunit
MTSTAVVVQAIAPPAPAVMEAAELIVRLLEEAGVEYVFGIPGGAVEPLYNALARSARRGGPRPVVARHESGAAFMADGYARETGKLGVCLTTSGPGATNMITGLACAYSNNVPLLALSGQPALPSFGKGALQESSCTGVNTVGMLDHCTRFNSLISHPDQVETKLVAAILHAVRAPQGPTHLSIPVDLLRGPVVPRAPAYDLSLLVGHKPRLIDPQGTAALRRELAAASRPLFLIGAQATGAADAIVALARLSGALFISTPDAKGLVNPHHPAYRGVFGFGGHASAERALKSADLVVAFGTGFGELASAGWSGSLLDGRLVHVDESEENLIRSPMARLHVRGSMRALCEDLIAGLRGVWSPEGKPCPLPRVEPGAVTLESPADYASTQSPIKPQRLMKELSERFPPSTRFLADAGNSLVWATHYLQPTNRRDAGDRLKARGDGQGERRSRSASWLRMALDFAPMGWSIGAAVGISRANPRHPVVCITGDGAYLMSGQEIATAVEEQLPVVFVILNDHAYGMVMHGQRLAGAEPIAYELAPVDFAAMARAMGVTGHVVEDPADFDRIDFAAMLCRRGPTLLDVRIDREAVPPMILRLKTLGSVKGES